MICIIIMVVGLVSLYIINIYDDVTWEKCEDLKEMKKDTAITTIESVVVLIVLLIGIYCYMGGAG